MLLKLFGNQRTLLFSAAALVVVGFFCFLTLLNKPQNPDVVLITIDALRADHLSCYGYKRDTSPNIDALAREGTLFTQAIAQSSHTPPSIGAIATSTYPPTNRLRDWGDSLSPVVPTLAEILRARGYRTMFVGSNPLLHKSLYGFERGFDKFCYTTLPASAPTRKALELVGETDSSPLFLWVHYMDVHQYAPDGEFEGLYVNDEFYNEQKKLPLVKGGPISYGHNGIPMSLTESTRSGGIDNPDYYVALYDGAIRSVDRQIGFLLEELKRTRGKRDALIIVTADHGEMLGEHGYYFDHGFFLYEPLIRVPFILRRLRRLNKAQVKKVNAQIRAGLDVLPTILGALRIKKPATAQGVDLMPMLTKGSASSSYVLSDEANTLMSVRTEGWKLTCLPEENKLPDTYELFNLKDDPGETVNLVSGEEREFGTLKKELDEYRKNFPRTGTAPPVFDEETRGELKALGYLQ